MQLRSLLILAALLLALLPAALPARTIEWGNSVGDTLLDSNGNALDDSYIFELGSFGAFVPTESNMDQWASNWKVFDQALAPAAEGWNSAFSYFSSAATIQAGGASSEFPTFTFQPDEQAYIWIYNGLTMAPGTEWGLFANDSLDGSAADDWLFTAPGDKTELPLEWRLFDARTIVFGGLDGTQGPGDYTADPPAFALQTHTVPIPEPSGALLLSLTGTIFVAVYRRRRTNR